MLRMLINAFIVYRNTIGPVNYYEDREAKLYVSGQELYISTIVVADSVVVWRLYVVWGKKLWIAAMPAMMIIGTAISGFGAVSQFLTPHPVYLTAVNWATAMYAISLATNIIVTTVTAFRIWFISYRHNSTLGRSENPYFRVILLVVESGLFLAAAKIVEFALYRVSVNIGTGGDHSLWIVLNCMPQIMGILPTLIVLAVNAGFTRRDEYYNTSHSVSMSFAPNDSLPATSTAVTSSSVFDDPVGASKKTLVDIPLYPVHPSPVRVRKDNYSA